MKWLRNIKNKLGFKRKQETPKALDVVDDPADESKPWWGTFLIEEEQSRYIKIGNIVLCLDRYNKEWHITTYKEGEEPFRSFAAQAPNTIILKPTLPNRALLSRLDRPIYIPTNQSLLLYVSYPLWIRLEAGTPPILLDEIPTEILADTWFGKNTLEGDLCYAGNIQCSPRLEDLSHDLTHVLTPINIENRCKETLYLHELKLPLPSLSVYSDNENQLWTEQLTVLHENPGHMEILVAKGPQKSQTGFQLISPPRLAGLKPGLKNIFSSFMWK